MSIKWTCLLLLLTLVVTVQAAGRNTPRRFQKPNARALPSRPAPIPLTHPQQAPLPSSPVDDPVVRLSPVFVPVEQITDKIITNITINLPPPAAQPSPVLQIPVVGPPAPSHPPVAAPVVSTQAPPPPPPPPAFAHGTLLQHIHNAPPLGLFSLYLSLPFLSNITNDILNQTTNPVGVAERITVFGPSNIGVLRFMRRLMVAREVMTALKKGENTTCDPQDMERVTLMKSMYEHLNNMSEAFYENTRERNAQAGNIQAHHNMLQAFIPQYHDMFNKANFTEDEKAFMRNNLLYHIANSSIHLFDIPPLSFPSTLMNDSRFVLLNSPSHPHPVVSQRLQLVKHEEWPGERRVELRFGVPGSGYYKSRVATDPHLRNILASNGILHVIDRIQVLPLNISATLYLADLVSALSVLNNTDLLDRVDVTPNITLFIPTDEAFAYAYGYNLIKHNKTLLEHVILHHIVAGVHDTRDLTSPLLTYNNDTIIPHRIGINSYIIEDANIIVPNILFKNGIIHIIDKVLTNPPLLGQPAAESISPHYPSQPFPRIPPFQPRPVGPSSTNITCSAGEQVCHIMNVVTNETSPYPTCYTPSTHVCVNNSFLCPLSAPYACGASCYNITSYECQTMFAEGRLHYILTPRTSPYTSPTYKPAVPTASCPSGDQVCHVMDIRMSTTEAKPQCYNPYTHVCSNNTFLCPVTHPFVCGYHCYDTTFYTCFYGFFNNSFQWMLQPTPTMIALQNKTAATTTTPITTSPVSHPPVHMQPPTSTPIPIQPQPHRPTPHPRPTRQPTPHPQPTHQPTPHPQPTQHPTAPPTILTCPSNNHVCHVKSPFLASTAATIPTCYDPHTHVCANATFLCPVSAPLLCDKHCYNATVFECVNGALRQHTPHIQPRLSPLVASHVQPKPLSTSTPMTHLPCRVDLMNTYPTTTGAVTVTHASLPSPISIEIPSGITNTPGVTASRVVSMPAGARVALVGEAQLSTILEALMSLPEDVRQRLSTRLSSP